MSYCVEANAVSLSGLRFSVCTAITDAQFVRTNCRCVLMGLLVRALSRLLQNSSEAVLVEVLGSLTFYAVQSDIELEILRLFPLDKAAVL